LIYNDTVIRLPFPR